MRACVRACVRVFVCVCERATDKILRFIDALIVILLPPYMYYFLEHVTFDIFLV